MSKDKYQRSPDCLLEDMGGEVLLYNPLTTEALQLNESAQIVWQLCDGTRSVADIVVAIQKLHPDQANQVPEDVNFVIMTLLRRKALQRAR